MPNRNYLFLVVTPFLDTSVTQTSRKGVFRLPLCPAHRCGEWKQTACLAAARMRQQLILGCPPHCRYRVSNRSSWLDTLAILGRRQSSKQVNRLPPPAALSLLSLINGATNTSAGRGSTLSRCESQPLSLKSHPG